jgi:peptidoglycan/LPS O-acetylase OafA/YrhL
MIGFLGILFQSNPIPDGIKYSIGTICVAFLLAGLPLLPFSLKLILTNKYLSYFGLISFSLYLWQQPFYAMKSQYPLGSLLLVLIPVSLASFYLIERPSREYLNRIFR